MTLYLDLILFLNFFFDFLLLLTVSIILKRNVSIYRIMLGSFLGGFTILLLFTKISNEQLFILKIVLSTIFIIVTFSYKNIKYTLENILYFYITSFFLGGCIYAFHIEKWFQNIGLAFSKKNFSSSFLILFILGPLFLYLYKIEMKKIKLNYQKYYKITIKIGKKKWLESGFLDTGNKLCDPVSKKPVILICEKKFEMMEKGQKFVYVPYKTITEKGIIKCLFIDSIDIEGVGKYQNILLGKMKDKIMMDGIDVILNERIWEG